MMQPPKHVLLELDEEGDLHSVDGDSDAPAVVGATEGDSPPAPARPRHDLLRRKSASGLRKGRPAARRRRRSRVVFVLRGRSRTKTASGETP